MQHLDAKNITEHIMGQVNPYQKEYLNANEIFNIFKIASGNKNLNKEDNNIGVKNFINKYSSKEAPDFVHYKTVEEIIQRIMQGQKEDSFYKKEQRVTFSQSINETQFIKTHSQTISDSDKEFMNEAEQIFEQYDRDQDGWLDLEDIDTMLRDTYLNMGDQREPSDEEIFGYFKALDWDQDGKVSKSDYFNYIKANISS